MAKPIKIVLELGPEWIMAEAADWRSALVAANNLFEMVRPGLRPGWRLRIEEDKGPD